MGSKKKRARIYLDSDHPPGPSGQVNTNAQKSQVTILRHLANRDSVLAKDYPLAAKPPRQPSKASEM